jgi:hypothetical protein
MKIYSRMRIWLIGRRLQQTGRLRRITVIASKPNREIINIRDRSLNSQIRIYCSSLRLKLMSLRLGMPNREISNNRDRSLSINSRIRTRM